MGKTDNSPQISHDDNIITTWTEKFCLESLIWFSHETTERLKAKHIVHTIHIPKRSREKKEQIMTVSITKENESEEEKNYAKYEEHT